MTTRVMLVSPAVGEAQREVRFDDDGPLSEAGLRRVRAVAGELTAADRAFASPSVRCRRTAEELGLSVLPAGELAGCAMGSWRGRTLAEVADAEPVAVVELALGPGFHRARRGVAAAAVRPDRGLADADGPGGGPGAGRRRTGCCARRGGVRPASLPGGVLAAGRAAADRDRAEWPGRALESGAGAGAGPQVTAVRRQSFKIHLPFIYT